MKKTFYEITLCSLNRLGCVIFRRSAALCVALISDYDAKLNRTCRILLSF